MAVTTLNTSIVPFQGTYDLSTNAQTCTADMSFVNDGYTILVVTNADPDNALTVTISGVADDAGRNKTLTATVSAAGSIQLFGPLRPIWWNQAGEVEISFSTGATEGVPNSLANIGVQVLKLQF